MIGDDVGPQIRERMCTIDLNYVSRSTGRSLAQLRDQTGHYETQNLVKEYGIFFDDGRVLNLRNAKHYNGVTGIYFIYNAERTVQYPFRESSLIYIGMSEKKTNSIGSRLQEHLEGTSGNEGLVSYRKVNDLFFTVLNSQLFKASWGLGIEALESYFILDFVYKYGVYPICNNKSGYDVLTSDRLVRFSIDWKFFEK